jgi:hypothetical protein
MPDQATLRSFNLFLTISETKKEIPVIKSIDHPEDSKPVFNYYYFINFWTVELNYNSNKSLEDNQFTVLRAELFPKKVLENENASQTEIISPINMDWSVLETDFINGCTFKNTIQLADRYLKNGKRKSLTDEVIPTASVLVLKTDTFFVPDYTEGSTSPINYQRLFKSYKYPWKLISISQWKEKILNNGKNFYYFEYIQSGSDKIISVINGFTAEVIYSVSTQNAFKLK